MCTRVKIKLTIISFYFQPLGMITRKDLAKFRAGTKRGLVKIEHLKIEDN